MTDWLPIILLIVSVFLLILSIFLYFYYANGSVYATIFFIIGILFGIVACFIFIHKRSPSQCENPPLVSHIN